MGTPTGPTRLLPVVALVGRPNVGKSTLYNVLTRTRDAIVSDLSGLTRDRHYGICESSEGHRYMVVDTAGLTVSPDALTQHMAGQARIAVEEADVILLVVDGRAGLLRDDIDIAAELRRSGKPVLLVVNKTDGLDEELTLTEFATLGLPSVGTSAAHRRGVNDLQDEFLELLGLPDEPPPEEEFDPRDDRCRVAIVGRPNVGKSTLINRLLGEERLLTFDQAGTTRDAIEVEVEWDERPYLLIDTAGMRRRSRIDEAVEKFSVIKAFQAIDQAQVVVFVIDAREGFAEQDATILGQVLDSGRALVIAINKWDGLSNSERTEVRRRLDLGLDFLEFAKRIPISALHGSGLGELMKAVRQAWHCALKEFSTNDLTEAITAAFVAHQPPLVNGRASKMRYVHQGGRNPPRIVIHGSRLKNLPESYKRYLQNSMRKRFRLIGTPVKLEFREGKNPFADRKNTLTDRQMQKKRRLLKHVKR